MHECMSVIQALPPALPDCSRYGTRVSVSSAELEGAPSIKQALMRSGHYVKVCGQARGGCCMPPAHGPRWLPCSGVPPADTVPLVFLLTPIPQFGFKSPFRLYHLGIVLRFVGVPRGVRAEAALRAAHEEACEAGACAVCTDEGGEGREEREGGGEGRQLVCGLLVPSVARDCIPLSR